MGHHELPLSVQIAQDTEPDSELYSPDLIDTPQELAEYKESRFITMLPDYVGDHIIGEIDKNGDGIPDNNDGDGMPDYAERYILESISGSNPGFVLVDVDWDSLVASYDMSGFSVFESEDGTKLNLISSDSPQVNINGGYLNEIIGKIKESGIALTPFVRHEDGRAQIYNIEFDWDKNPWLWLYEDQGESVPGGAFPVYIGSEVVPDLSSNVWQEEGQEAFWDQLSSDDWKDIRFLSGTLLGYAPDWRYVYEDQTMWEEALDIATGIVASQEEYFNYETYMTSFPNLDEQTSEGSGENVVQGYYLSADFGGLGNESTIQAMSREPLSYFTGMEPEELVLDD
ncbi:hypothetical protein GF362_01490 [Candidatus Dojkabacteria bacterium]|nr:hypothetical protein [Candidatus Dojkabacteria bacterium]